MRGRGSRGINEIKKQGGGRKGIRGREGIKAIKRQTRKARERRREEEG